MPAVKMAQLGTLRAWKGIATVRTDRAVEASESEVREKALDAESFVWKQESTVETIRSSW